jgi:hypothetical protein
MPLGAGWVTGLPRGLVKTLHAMHVIDWRWLQIQHLKNFINLMVTMEAMGGGMVTPFNVVRPCGRRLLLRGPWT